MRRSWIRTGVVSLLLLTAWSAGCGSTPRSDDVTAAQQEALEADQQAALAEQNQTVKQARATRVELAQRRYPADSTIGEDLYILVTQQRTRLTLINQTPRVYEGVSLWVNQQYVTDLPPVPIGSPLRIPLEELINRHGENYPIPGLLTPDRAYPVVSAELFDPTTRVRHRLVVRRTGL